ncbi:DUF4123 domain-containing protein [Enterobacter cloacae subsp. cloacae]|uniref:DUF4123 domain-containing protein n=1 Tax=Enterobacter cloacae TaxID=550 RepID=UPI0021D00AD6|nr:DUF4123 domain-containing protein [Enterobacter cloacae]MCU6313080.1 DUF4123 domain-containing protein [Enterobacter cloacae]WLD32073.1 DUF4123 domain-containing protein [Enterobacter cloacae subsp. cloacae]
MNATNMIQALTESKKAHLFLLLEGGAQTTEAFQAFYNENAAVMYSLYLHPQLTEVRDYGPWLFAIKDKDELTARITSTPGLTAVIASSRSAGALAVQLSAACTMIYPEGAATLVRFYMHDVIRLLAGLNEREWHSLLFREISQWWVPGENEWRQIPIPASKVINARDSAIRLNHEEWQHITDRPAVAVVLAAWQKMPSSQHFPACVQRDMVIKALNKASEAKMKAGTEQKLYALYYLNGGKKNLESEAVQAALEKVVQRKVSLEYVLFNHAHSQG